MQMKNLLATLSVVLFANQGSADGIRVGDVYYCNTENLFQATSGADAEIKKYKNGPLKFKVEESTITFGNNGVLVDESFYIKQLSLNALQDGGYTDTVYALGAFGQHVRLEYVEDTVNILYANLGNGQIFGLIASCDKF